VGETQTDLSGELDQLNKRHFNWLIILIAACYAGTIYGMWKLGLWLLHLLHHLRPR
jgi:hypothetical protein